MMDNIGSLNSGDVFTLKNTGGKFKFIKLVKRRLPRIGTTYVADCIDLEDNSKAKFTDGVDIVIINKAKDK